LEELEKRVPIVSVIMPVHNAALYLHSSITSILNQTFSDFEFIIVDDGSTDESIEIIESFTDSRIQILRHSKALGVSAAMNKAFNVCKGQFIARMDADDVSLPKRFERQVNYMLAHSEVDIVFSRIEQIDVYGNPAGSWLDDERTIDFKDIKRLLPWRNCLANPTFMMRSFLTKKYSLPLKFHVAEDYAYWLMILSHGHLVAKVDDILLQYRIHPASLTVSSNRTNPNRRYLEFQWNYFKMILSNGPYNDFHFRFLLSFLSNLISYPWRSFVKPAISAPLKVWRARPFALWKKYRNLKTILQSQQFASGNLFFFFPFYHVGGAERVHSDILRCLEELNPIVFFTKKSENDGFLARFEKSARCIDLADLCRYPVFKNWTYELISEYINAKEKATLFGCNSIAMYEMIPGLKREVRVIDLIHAFVHPEETGPEKWSFPVVSRIDLRVLISQKTIEELKVFYRNNRVDSSLLNRVKFIRNYTQIPEFVFTEASAPGALKVLYVGRASAEKRIHLIGRIAHEVRLILPQIAFRFIGKDLETAMNDLWRNDCEFVGEISTDEELGDELKRAHLLIMTSSREGFPMVIMEAMAYGVATLSTAVGDIPNVISHGENGYLLFGASEDEIVGQAVQTIVSLNSDRVKLAEVQRSARNYAEEEFGWDRFCKSYREILVG